MANNKTKNKGRLVIISGPSGVGKGTICREVVKRLENVYLNVSVTTRPKTEQEVDGNDYCFISKEQFQQYMDQDSFLEYAEVFGNLYGTLKNKVEEALGQGHVVILEIDVQGAQKVKLIYPDAAMIFILPPSQRELAERINNRGREDAQTAESRLEEADDEIAAAWQHYEYMVINSLLEQAVKEVVDIIQYSNGEKQ